MPSFVFRLQAKLDQAIELRDAALAQLKSAQAACAREQALLDQRTQRLADHLALLERQRCSLAEPLDSLLSSDQLARRDAYCRRLERTSSALESDVRVQAGHLDAAQALHRLRSLAAERAVAQVGALERLAEKQRREFESMQQLRTDADNDEAAAQLWVRANRREDSHERQP